MTTEAEKKPQIDNIRIQKCCEKYLNNTDSILKLNQINVRNFYIDENKKLGWCVVPKVSYIRL